MGGGTQALTSITLTHHASHSSLWEEELATALLAHEKGLAEICMWWDLGFISLFFFSPFTNSILLTLSHAIMIRGKKGFGQPDLSSLPALSILSKRSGVVIREHKAFKKWFGSCGSVTSACHIDPNYWDFRGNPSPIFIWSLRTLRDEVYWFTARWFKRWPSHTFD